MNERIKVFITVFNRFAWLIPLLEDFKKAGCDPILIDNNSTYPPLLDWYKTCSLPVHFLGKNHLAWAFFTTELYKLYDDRYFIISDSDMDISKVPDDFVDVLFRGLENSGGRIWKCALGYELDDLPVNAVTQAAYSANIAQESNRNEQGYSRCATDLGIALYDRSRRGSNPTRESDWYDSLRAPRPYYCRHLDWYMTPETLRDEDRYYLKEARYFSYLALMNEKMNPFPIRNQWGYSQKTLMELFQEGGEARYHTDKQTQHSYLPIYDKLFMPWKEKDCKVFECGFASGGFLKLMEDYFDKAEILGIDKIGDLMKEVMGVNTSKRVRTVKLELKELNKGFFESLEFIPDIAIDDSSHVIEDQLTFVNVMWDIVKPGGLIIIEDVLKTNVNEFLRLGLQYEVVDLSDDRPGQLDNILIIFKR